MTLQVQCGSASALRKRGGDTSSSNWQQTSHDPAPVPRQRHGPMHRYLVRGVAGQECLLLLENQTHASQIEMHVLSTARHRSLFSRARILRASGGNAPTPTRY